MKVHFSFLLKIICTEGQPPKKKSHIDYGVTGQAVLPFAI